MLEPTSAFGLIAEIFYVGVSEPEQQSVPFSWATADWQCAVGTIVPKESGKTIRRIIVYCAFDHNSGTARFDNLSLRQEPVQTYFYNADGNVTAATQTGTGTEKAGKSFPPSSGMSPRDFSGQLIQYFSLSVKYRTPPLWSSPRRMGFPQSGQGLGSNSGTVFLSSDSSIPPS